MAGRGRRYTNPNYNQRLHHDICGSRRHHPLHRPISISPPPKHFLIHNCVPEGGAVAQKEFVKKLKSVASRCLYSHR